MNSRRTRMGGNAMIETLARFPADLVRFLNANQGAFLVMFSAAVAYSTWKYARLTQTLVRETARMREAETEPSLAVYLIPQERWVNLIDVVVRNYGAGPAHDIKWNITARDEETRSRYARLLDLGLFQGLSYLPPGEQIRTYIGSAVDLLKEPPAGPITIEARYKNAEGELRTKSFVLDIQEYRNLSQSPPPEYEIAHTLKGLHEDVRRALSDHVRVATVTEKELQKEREDWIREMQAKSTSIPPNEGKVGDGE